MHIIEFVTCSLIIRYCILFYFNRYSVTKGFIGTWHCLQEGKYNTYTNTVSGVLFKFAKTTRDIKLLHYIFNEHTGQTS